MSITPGPWTAECFDPAEFPCWWRVMADMPGDPVGDAMSQDDARLMAAAPDLLEALVEIVASDDEAIATDDPFDRRYDAALLACRAAISKAKGTTDERSTA